MHLRGVVGNQRRRVGVRAVHQHLHFGAACRARCRARTPAAPAPPPAPAPRSSAAAPPPRFPAAPPRRTAPSLRNAPAGPGSSGVRSMSIQAMRAWSTSRFTAKPKTINCTIGGTNSRTRMRGSRSAWMNSFRRMTRIRSHMVSHQLLVQSCASPARTRSPRYSARKPSSTHSTLSPTPFRNTPFKIVTKYRAGTMYVITWITLRHGLDRVHEIRTAETPAETSSESPSGKPAAAIWPPPR